MTLTRQEAFRRIHMGGLLIYPTETFFGIGCRADDEAAVVRVFRCKRRSLSMPLPVILGSAEQLGLVACPGPELAGDLDILSRFWPGPLTLLLPVVSGLPEALTAPPGNWRLPAVFPSYPQAPTSAADRP